jgi:hypothetical protein
MRLGGWVRSGRSSGIATYQGGFMGGGSRNVSGMAHVTGTVAIRFSVRGAKVRAKDPVMRRLPGAAGQRVLCRGLPDVGLALRPQFLAGLVRTFGETN